ncbi:MAG: MetQ/NlpA family ABC transporter substrate-binding protein [Halanaerobiaceae bacterium]
MDKSWKKILLFVLLGMLAIASAGCVGGEEAEHPDEINFGILRVPNDETIAIAEGLFDKYFAEEGIKYNLRVFDSGAEANQALASGEIDFAHMGNTNAITAKSRELGVEMIWIHEVLGEIEALAVKEDSDINEVEDLAGEKIAVPFASTSHYILLNVLKEAGIEEEVELLDMKTAEVVAAWERGDIKAAYVWQPSLGKILETGRVLVSSADMIEEGYITANVEVVRKEFSEKYPGQVVSYIACMKEAADIYREDPQEAAAIVADELEISEDEALLQMQGSNKYTPEELLGDDFFGTSEEAGQFAEIMKDTSDFLQEQDSIDNSPSREEYNKYVNPEYIERYLDEYSE